MAATARDKMPSRSSRTTPRSTWPPRIPTEPRDRLGDGDHAPVHDDAPPSAGSTGHPPPCRRRSGRWPPDGHRRPRSPPGPLVLRDQTRRAPPRRPPTRGAPPPRDAGGGEEVDQHPATPLVVEVPMVSVQRAARTGGATAPTRWVVIRSCPASRVAKPPRGRPAPGPRPGRRSAPDSRPCSRSRALCPTRRASSPGTKDRAVPMAITAPPIHNHATSGWTVPGPRASRLGPLWSNQRIGHSQHGQLWVSRTVDRVPAFRWSAHRRGRR
ncbi:MAG: hypothetical protein CM1200mP26_00560 [Acidimicrobiales bacterium]|nr:MAG: hypothetical protein CM1200mP26_00560 [Acidimicrobiales bacterium]